MVNSFIFLLVSLMLIACVDQEMINQAENRKPVKAQAKTEMKIGGKKGDEDCELKDEKKELVKPVEEFKLQGGNDEGCTLGLDEKK